MRVIHCNHRVLYGSWRVFWAVYHVTWVLLSWVLEPWALYTSSARAKWFVYLTNWMYLLLTIETVLEAVNFFCVHVLRDDIVKGKQCFMPWYLKLQWVLYNVVTTGSLMVTAWYWGAVYKGSKEVGAVSVAFHAVNSVYVLLNLFITATPTRLLHFVHPVLFGMAYTLFSLVYQLSGGTNIRGEPFVYSVLDWSKPGRTLFLSSCSNFFAIPVMHLFVFLLHVLFTRFFCPGGWRKRGGGVGSGLGGTGVTCVDLGERGTESSSVQGEPLVSEE
nr:hypothetical protein BaRGS_002000 [Batillaria attramentaria]